MKEKLKALMNIFIVILLFLLVTYYVQTNLTEFSKMFDKGFKSQLIYILIVVVSVVIAPFSAVPILPLASALWGWFLAAILSILGWLLGGIIAFLLARKYGKPLIKKIVSLEKIEKIEKIIPTENVFWSLVFLRMVIPVDVLSYGVGLFSRIKFRVYFLATLIGILPFAFILSYIGSLPFYFQVTLLGLALTILFFGYLMHRNRKKK